VEEHSDDDVFFSFFFLSLFLSFTSVKVNLCSECLTHAFPFYTM